MTNPPLTTLGPTQTLALDTGLTLTPRIKLLLTITRSDHSSVSPIDEWTLKRSLIDFLKSSFKLLIPEHDLEVRKFKDLNKRKRDEPVARGTLFVHDLGFLDKLIGDGDDVEGCERRFVEWRREFVKKLDGIELNLEGNRFKLSVKVPKSDDYEGMRKEWEEAVAFGVRGYQRSRRMEPDTIILRGMPSRWFAETRVSSKPSMLVTHTILSSLGKIRNLEVAEDNCIGEDADEGDIVSGLHCKIVVRFESHKDFSDALKVLCGRSLQKQGSRLRADYDVTWDKDGFFRNARPQIEERKRWVPARGVEERDEAQRNQSHDSRVSQFNSEEGRRKRFKE